MLSRKVIVSSVLAATLFAGIPKTGKTETPDSGIFGVVAYQASLVHTQQQQVDILVNKLATAPDPDHHISRDLDQAKAVLDEMQNRCVQAFDPKSELPASYFWWTTDLSGMTEGSGACIDKMRFPHDFMKLLTAGPCRNDGSFRLALAPGRYAVFIGMTPRAPFSGLGPSGWWQYVDVAPHQWLQLALPTRDYGAACTSDADCLGPTQCLEIPSGKGTLHECLNGSRSEPPAYDSGIRGRIGAPLTCYGNWLGGRGAPPGSQQCIEAFRQGTAEMAACAKCRPDYGGFVLPLPPGRYVLEVGDESRAVEVAAGQWGGLYLQGAKPGHVEVPPCPN